jgi:hypothetical protein
VQQPINPPHNHHVIPVFYLKGFVDPCNKPFLWEYRADGETKKISPKKAGYIDQYHVFEDSKGNRNSTAIENFYGKIENMAAPVLKFIDDNSLLHLNVLENKKRRTLLWFVNSLLVRVPAFHKYGLPLINEFKLFCDTADPNDREGFYRGFKKRMDLPRGPIVTNIEVIRQELLKGKVIEQNPHTISLLTSINNLESGKLINVFTKMNGTFVRERDGYFFVTGDNPVFICNNSGLGYGAGISDRTTEITIPLSRKVALILYWGEYRKIPSSAAIVRDINKKTIANSLECIFASENRPELKTFVHKNIGKLINEIIVKSAKRAV